MSKVMIDATYDITPYMLGRPIIKVVSSTINGSLFLQESSVSLRYVKGMFDGIDPTFKINVSVTIYDDKNVIIFEGYLRSVEMSSGTTTLTLVSALSKYLGGVINWLDGPDHPAYILDRMLRASGLTTRGITQIVIAYPDMLALSTARSSDNIKGYDYISMIADMMTMDLVIENGVVIGMPRPPSSVGVIGTIESMSYPTMADSGASKLIMGVNLKYTFDGEVPLSFGTQTEYCWSATYDATSPVQCYGEAAAVSCAQARMDRYGVPHPVYQLKVRASKFEPSLGSWYYVNEGPMNGNFRLVGYEFDGEIYYPMLEGE